jgi:hypothetical protein
MKEKNKKVFEKNIFFKDFFIFFFHLEKYFFVFFEGN